MRVNINANGRQVEIECSDANVTPKDIAAEALAVWRATQPDTSRILGFGSPPENGTIPAASAAGA